MTQTLALIKPECIREGLYPEILRKILNEGFKIVKMELKKLSPSEAKKFYAIHEEKIFFPELIENITSGSLIALVLEKNENVIVEWRKFIGDTNPEKANPGSLRRMFGFSFSQNGFHGSDSIKNSRKEIKIIFPY